MLPPARRNPLVMAGCLAALLGSADPGLAKPSFDVFFNSAKKGTSFYNTSVTGQMTFRFTADPLQSNTYVLDLDIKNTSPLTGPGSGTLVAFAFNEPLISGSNKEAASLLRYNPLSSGFGRVFGNRTSGIEAKPAADLKDSLNITNLRTAPYAPFSNFDFCARVSSSAGCHGGSGNKGIKGGESVQVQFQLQANSSSGLATVGQVAESFYNLFEKVPSKLSDAQIALRFQDVRIQDSKKPDGKKVDYGEKVTAYRTSWRLPDQGPTDDVPGPLPILGAAASFAWSRRLRRRIQSSRLRDASIS